MISLIFLHHILCITIIKQFSDHQPYFNFMDTTHNKQSNPKTTKIHMETNESLLRVKHDIHTSDIYSKMDKSPSTDTNFNYNLIDQIMKLLKIYTYKLKLSNSINIDIKNQTG